MLAGLHRSLEAIPEHRTGRNTQYEIQDAGLAACRRGGSISSPQAEFDASVDDKHAVINRFDVP
jgi:hypothetical protein